VPEDFAAAQRKGWIRQKDILIVKDGATTGKVSFVGSDFPYSRALLNEHVFRCAVNPSIDAKFVFYWLFSSEGHRQILRDFRGAAQGGISRGFTSKVDVPIAPIREQHRIVEAIESGFTRLDRAVELLERVKRNLKRYRVSVLKAAIEGRLVATDAELARSEGRAYEPASALLERIVAERRRRSDSLVRRGKYEIPKSPDTVETPEIPEGWCWANIGKLFDVVVGATPSRSKPTFWDGGIPWVSSGEVAFCRIKTTRETITAVGYENSSTKLSPAGTVLMGMIGEGRTRGQVAILDIAACNNQNAAAIRVSESGLSPEYVYYYLMSMYDENRRLGSGNNQPALNKSRVQAIPLPLPPLAEQHRIARAIEDRLSIVDHAEADLAIIEARCTRLRQAILKWAFEGKLANQDPKDEPASALLARSKAEREMNQARNRNDRPGRARKFA